MPKIEILKVASILQKNHLEPELLRRVVEEMNLAVEAANGKEPPTKKQFIILVSDPEGRLPQADLVGWVLQLPESESPATTQDRLFKVAGDFNASKRGARHPVKTVGEALENVPGRLWGSAALSVKTRIPVLVLRTDNALPKA